MKRDHALASIHLTGIHINLVEQAIEFEDQHGAIGRLRFTGEQVLYEGQPLLLTPNVDPDAAVEQSVSPRPDTPHPSDRPRRPSRNASPQNPRLPL